MGEKTGQRSKDNEVKPMVIKSIAKIDTEAGGLAYSKTLTADLDINAPFGNSTRLCLQA